ELDLLFQVFPSDDRLPSLATAVDAAAVRPSLESALAQHASGARLESVSARVMRYKPERKCLLRYALAWSDAAPAGAPTLVWARTARRAKFERSWSNLSRIHPFGSGIGYALPDPLGVIADLSMELFGPVPGVALFTVVDRPDFPALCRRTGEYLRRFHALPVEMDEVFDVSEQLVRLEENAIEFGWMLPDERSRIEDAARSLAPRLRAET